MGALVSCSQRDDVRKQIAQDGRMRARASSPATPTPRSAPTAAPSCSRSCSAPTIRGAASAVHDVEAFGPVSTIMPYRDMADAIALANRGMGSLALSLFTYSPDAAREFIQGAAAFHGRMLVLNRDNAPRKSPATARRCPSSSTAAPAAPAAARRWAASAGSSITCSAPRSSRPRR